MGKLKALLALAIIIGGGYAAYAFLPVILHKYQLQDELDDIARRNSYTQKSDDDLRALVIQHASALDIPLKENQITISRTGDGLGISVQYSVHVDVVVRAVDLDFVVNSINKRI
jgi:hypothetical protein